MDPIVHFEIPYSDKERAQKFYSIFGWNFADMPMDHGGIYTGVHTTPVDDKHMPLEKGAINGGMYDRGDKDMKPTLVVKVPSIDERLKQVEEAGGKTTFGKIPINDMGFYAQFEDTEGNILGLWEDVKKEED